MAVITRDSLIAQIAAIPDAADRARAATELLAAVNPVSAIRVEAFEQLVADGWTYRRIAEAVGLPNHQWIGKLVKDRRPPAPPPAPVIPDNVTF